MDNKNTAIFSNKSKLQLVLLIIIIIMLVIGVLAHQICWYANHYIVKSDKGVVFVQKRFASLKNTCVDIRGWKWDDVIANQEVSKALVNAGYEDVLPEGPKPPSLMDKINTKIQDIKEKSSAHSQEFKDKLIEFLVQIIQVQQAEQY